MFNVYFNINKNVVFEFYAYAEISKISVSGESFKEFETQTTNLKYHVKGYQIIAFGDCAHASKITIII